MGSLFHLKVRWGEDSIFNAAACIGGKTRLACGIKGVYRFHQADGADGNKVFLVAGEGVVFFHDVCHQPQVVPDELFPRSGVPGPQRGESFGFFPGREWLWKAAAFQMECQDQKFGGKKIAAGSAAYRFPPFIAVKKMHHWNVCAKAWTLSKQKKEHKGSLWYITFCIITS